MALNPQQLQALFQAISSGQQGGFSNATPGMSQDERNQWINQYGNGGTGYGDYMNWYQQNQAQLNQQGPMYQPGGIFYHGGSPQDAGTGLIRSDQQNAYTASQAAPAYTTPSQGSTATSTGANFTQGYGATPQPQLMPAAVSGGAQTRNTQPQQPQAANPYYTGGQASDGRIFNPTQGNAFLPPAYSAPGAAYNPGGATQPPPVTTAPPTTTTPNPNQGTGAGGGSGGGLMAKPKSYQINPMYYKGWNTSGGWGK